MYSGILWNDTLDTKDTTSDYKFQNVSLQKSYKSN